MAARKITCSIPGAVAKENALARTCEVANASEDIRTMEQEFDAISTDIAEPWTGAAGVQIPRRRCTTDF
jgi:hypothetical protein